ncbi:hypothetical protein AWB81_07945 [Caballeronia arationis]|uniref:hypothetical protein n=1 Tax=Caballeronia arationis TaxID=1777142 RepID=UPI00074C5F54|nr:hypothetical protein [Caballeronia arationis]SAL07175.1 hypothetical protein AWB81_07945 [Caballeronia arationis]
MSKDIEIVRSAPLEVAAMLWQQRSWCCAALVVVGAATRLPTAGYFDMAVRFAYGHLLHDASGIGRSLAGVLCVLLASLAWQVTCQRDRERPGLFAGACYWVVNRLAMPHIARGVAVVIGASAACGTHGVLFGAAFGVWFGFVMCCMQCLTAFSVMPRLR